jgi:hypothetical protein
MPYKKKEKNKTTQTEAENRQEKLQNFSAPKRKYYTRIYFPVIFRARLASGCFF